MQDRLDLKVREPLGQYRPAHRVRSVIAVVGVVYLPANELAAVQVKDQVQIEPLIPLRASPSHLHEWIHHDTNEFRVRRADIKAYYFNELLIGL